MLLTIEAHGSKIDRNSVFECHWWPVRREMAIKNSVMIFDLHSWTVLTFSIAAYPLLSHPVHKKFVVLRFDSSFNNISINWGEKVKKVITDSTTLF